jgi:hypothetical protein
MAEVIMDKREEEAAYFHRLSEFVNMIKEYGAEQVAHDFLEAYKDEASDLSNEIEVALIVSRVLGDKA